MSQTKQKHTGLRTLHLGSGKNTKPKMWNVDKLDHTGVDEVVDLTEFPWPWENDSWDRILAEHIFEHLPDMEQTLRECKRVVRPGGQVEVVMPVGQDSWADPDHKHRWTYDTPMMYCGKRPWDPDVGLTVAERDVEIWPHAPGGGMAGTNTSVCDAVYGSVLKAALRVFPPGRWCFDLPATSGEFRVVFHA